MFILFEELKNKIEVESISKITKNTLVMRRYLNSFYGDFNEMFFGLFSIIFISFILFINTKELFYNLIYILLGLVVMVIFIWRRMLPICFNRETKMVTHWANGTLYQKKWEDVELRHAIIATGRGNIDLSAFELTGGRKVMFEKTFYLSTQNLEYITQYMNYKEPQLDDKALNEIKMANFEYKFLEVFLNLLPKKMTFFIILFSPLLIIEIPLYYTMFILNKILPRRKIPKELLDACACKENETVGRAALCPTKIGMN